MRLTVLTPSCDWPRGSGELNPNTPLAVRSVLDSGIDPLELWIALDGPQPAIEDYLASLKDDRITVLRTQKTSDSGNTQRHVLMERLRDQGQRGLFCFHDDDDAYLDGGLKAMYDISLKNKGCPVLARHAHPVLSEIATKDFTRYATGLTGPFNLPISFAASLFPILPGMPLWPKGGGYYDDLPYAQKFVEWMETEGKQEFALLDRVVTRLRPKDQLGTLTPEFHS